MSSLSSLTVWGISRRCRPSMKSHETKIHWNHTESKIQNPESSSEASSLSEQVFFVVWGDILQRSDTAWPKYGMDLRKSRQTLRGVLPRFFQGLQGSLSCHVLARRGSIKMPGRCWNSTSLVLPVVGHPNQPIQRSKSWDWFVDDSLNRWPQILFFFRLDFVCSACLWNFYLSSSNILISSLLASLYI